jgi:hypothetical protein
MFTYNKKGTLHMPKIIAQVNEDLKEILKKKITTQVLKRMAIILLYLLKIKVKEILVVFYIIKYFGKLSFKLYEKIDDIIKSESDYGNKLTDKIIKSIGISQSTNIRMP